jgi:hypothetical protein
MIVMMMVVMVMVVDADTDAEGANMGADYVGRGHACANAPHRERKH